MCKRRSKAAKEVNQGDGGENPVEFRQKHRVEKAKQLLLLDTHSIGEIAEELHFSDIYHFSKTFKKFTGVSPLQYTARLKDMKK